MPITEDATFDSSGISPIAGVLTIPVSLNGNYVSVSVQVRDDTTASVLLGVTALTKRIELNASNGLSASIWDLLSPSIGSLNVVVTSNSVGPSYLAATVNSLNGVIQSNHVDDTDSVETNGANPTFSGLTTTTDGCAIIDSLASNQSNQTAIMNAETNRVQRSSYFASPQARSVAASTIITKSPAGSVTMGWDINANNSAYVGLAVKPAVSNKFILIPGR